MRFAVILNGMVRGVFRTRREAQAFSMGRGTIVSTRKAIERGFTYDGTDFTARTKSKIEVEYLPLFKKNYYRFLKEIGEGTIRWQTEVIGKSQGEKGKTNVSIGATENWAFHTGKATYDIIKGVVGEGRNGSSVWTDEKKVIAIESFFELINFVSIWYGVMKGDANKRTGWNGFSTRNGAAVYVDHLTAAGDKRTIDGTTSIILTGSSHSATWSPDTILT